MFEHLFARRGLSLDRLRSFLEVVEAGSIVRATKGDPVRQSQYSRQISELESFFGVELLGRRGKRLQVTPAGKSLASAARAQLQGLADFQNACGQQPQSFRIGAGDSLLQWVIIPALPRFQALFPRTELFLNNLRSTDIAERLGDLRLDFGLARQSVIRKPLKHVSIGTVEYGLYIPQGILKELKKPQQQDDAFLLQNLPWVTLGSDASFMNQLQNACAEQNLSVNFRIITESFPQAARAVHSGSFAAILPLHARVDFNPKETVIRETEFLKSCSRKVCLAWNPKTLSFRPGIEPVLSFLKRELVVTR